MHVLINYGFLRGVSRSQYLLSLPAEEKQKPAF